MNQLQEILLSYMAKINPTDEQKRVAEIRLSTCMECEHWVSTPIRDYCNLCGCTTSAKVFSPKGADACPKHKWAE